MTRYEEIKAKSFDEMALFIDCMLNGSVCPMCDVKYCSHCGENEPIFEECSKATDDDCLAALRNWMAEEIGVPK